MWEECGYEVPLQNLQEIQTFPANVGCVSEPITMFYAEVLQTDFIFQHKLLIFHNEKSKI